MAGDSLPARSALVARQLEQLRQLLKRTLPSNRFYSKKLRASDEPLQLTSPHDLARLPLTTKAELVSDQLELPPFGTNLTFPIARYTRYHQTSGTTGTPLRWLDCPESWEWMVERWMEILQAAEVTQLDRIVFAFSFGPFIGFWLAFEAGARLGALCLPAGGLSSLGRLRMLLENEATVLCCTPTYALRLAEVAREEHVDLSQLRLRRIIVAGEAGGSIPATRKRLETLWPGARIFDHHGMTETGPVSFECPARPGFLHIMESGFIPEVIDPKTTRPVEAGEMGELVLTNLGRTGSPLIRYRTGDLVKAEANWPGLHDSVRPCACGRLDMVLEGGILGRSDNMVIVRGVNVYPTAVEHVVQSCGQIAEYQVHVSRSGALTELKLVIEPEADCADPDGLLRRVRNAFHQSFALRVPVELAAAGSLPRSEMKSRRWITDRKSASEHA